tara:strand:+ start:1172 stop:2965 length:1794 start_codon:yes stop_codon:yes gene_type:complete
MDLKNMSVPELRQYCLDNNLNFFDVLNSEDKPEAPKRKKVTSKRKPARKKTTRVRPRKKRSSLKNLVLDSLDEMRGVFSNGEDVSLDNFVGMLELDVQKGGYTPDSNCSLRGYVCSVLYEYAEESKFGRKYSKKITEPIKASELKKLLDLDFGEEGFRRIAGTLDSEIVETEYPLNEGIFQDENGEEFDIEGVKSWGSSHKSKIRGKLVELVRNHVISPIAEERRKLEQERVRLNSEMETSSEEQILDYEIKSGNPSPLMALKKWLKYTALNPSLEGADQELIQGIKIKHSNGKKSIVSFASEDSRKYFDNKLKLFFSKRPQQKELIEVKRNQNKSQKTAGLERKLNGINSSVGDIKNEFNYLGLEGPNFSSFFLLKGAFKDAKMKMGALLPEYSHRSSNLMASLIGAYPEDFSGAVVEERNVDELILLDFPKNPNFKIEPINSHYSVVFDSERIDLDDYQNLLDDIDKKLTSSHLSNRYNVSEKFIEAASERHVGKFDVVFLDYFGGIYERRDKALEILLRRRVSDRAILAATSNLNPRVNHKVLVPDIPDHFFDRVSKICEKEGIDINDLSDEQYKDGKNEMYFAAYELERNNSE